jgi:hypothetical protein
MTTLQFLAEWALRSSILIFTGWLLLLVLRVKDPSIRLAAWVVILCGSLALPGLHVILPKVPLTAAPVAVRVEAPAVEADAVPATPMEDTGFAKRFDWSRAAVAIYGSVVLRDGGGVGSSMSRRVASGRLSGFDNQIDQTTGVLKFKAVFENRDGALFPNQFVNVKLLLDSK